MNEKDAALLWCISPSKHAGSKLVPKAAVKGCSHSEKMSEWKGKITGIIYPAYLIIDRE